MGLLIGSFLNVVIWRVPRGESVVRPPSHCPTCERDIPPYDNIPVLSWLLLRGRCRFGGERISIRYPLVEAGTAALFAAIAVKVGLHPALPAYLYLAAISVALALIDIDVRRLPNVIVLPSYGVALALLTIGALEDGWSALLRAVLGMAAYYGLFFGLCLAYPSGMGFGDVKLAGVLGLYLGYLGWGPLVVGIFGGFFLGGVIGIAMMAVGRAGRKSAIPYGPFMVLGAMIAVFSGAQLAHGYVHLTSLS